MKRVKGNCNKNVNTVNSEIFMRILFSGIALKDIFVTLKIATRAGFTYIGKRQSDCAHLPGFNFHEKPS